MGGMQNGGLSSLFTERNETLHYFTERTIQLASFPGLHAQLLSLAQYEKREDAGLVMRAAADVTYCS